MDEFARNYKVITHKLTYKFGKAGFSCKEICTRNRMGQREMGGKVYCRTCGIFIKIGFTYLCGGGMRCLCCKQRVRTKSERGRKY